MPETTATLAREPLADGDLVLERYRIAEFVCAGGHSLVYRGTDERLSRSVCVKVFHRRTECDGVLRASYEHFVQEAFALSKLTHPNTLRIYDFGHLGEEGAGGAPFQISEWVNGGTLSQRIRTDGPIATGEAARLLDGLCGALAEAHHSGITHRDIKPQNVLFLDSAGRRAVKLVDFGIAKLSGAEEVAFRAGDTSVTAGRALRMLSPAWAAPEQITGDSVGPWTDIYSMALIAAYMTTGVALFAHANAEESFRLRSTGGHIDEALAASAAPERLIALIKRSCSVDPAHRPPTVEAFAHELADALGCSPRRGASVLLPLPSSPEDEPAAAPPLRVRVDPADPPDHVGDRRIELAATDGGVACVSAEHARVELSMITAGDRLVAHVKPRTCFVAISGKRPSSAVQLSESELVELVLPNQQPIAQARVCFGRAAAGHVVVELDDVHIALPVDACRRAVALDFGSGATCYIVYEPRRPLVTAASGGKRARRRKPR